MNATYRRLFEFHTAMGAGQIRIAGDVPHPGNGRRFEGWDRYEAAVNTVWQDFQVWGRCLYDTTTTPPTVVDVERTHPRIVSPTGERRESDRYQDALAFEDLPYAPDPLEGSTPVAELVNRPAADARHALARIARGSQGTAGQTPHRQQIPGPDRGVAWSGRHAVVTMPAEVDMTNATDVSDLLIAVAGESPEVITADIAATVFCDSAGVRALVRAHERADAGGSELRLALGDSPTARIIQLTGLDQIVPVYRSVQQSLATPRNGPAPSG